MYNNTNYTYFNGAPINGMPQQQQMMGVNPWMAGGMVYGQQQPIHFTNPLGQQKINENLKNGKGLPNLGITQEDYDMAVCTHRNPATNQIEAHPMNDGSGKVKCRICGAEFHVIENADMADIKTAADNLWDIGQTAKMMWLDGADNTIKQAFQILALIPKYPALYSIAVNTLQRYNGGSLSTQNTGNVNPMGLLNQIFGGPMNGMGMATGYQQPMGPMGNGMAQPMQMQGMMPQTGQPMTYDPSTMNPAASQMLAGAPGMASNGFGFTNPAGMPQQQYQMNLDPNAQLNQQQMVNNAQPSPAPAPSTTQQKPAPKPAGGATVTETLSV